MRFWGSKTPDLGLYFDAKMTYFWFLIVPKRFLKKFFFGRNRVEIEGFGVRNADFGPLRGGPKNGIFSDRVHRRGERCLAGVRDRACFRQYTTNHTNVDHRRSTVLGGGGGVVALVVRTISVI